MRIFLVGQLVLGIEVIRLRRVIFRRDFVGGKEFNLWWGLQGVLGFFVLCVYFIQVFGLFCQVISFGDKRLFIRLDVRMFDCFWKSQQVVLGFYVGGGCGFSGCFLEGVCFMFILVVLLGNQGVLWWVGVLVMREELDFRLVRLDRGFRVVNGGQFVGGVFWSGGWGFI